MTEPKPPTAREREAERDRCGVCGLIHPFLVICPFIEEREVRYEIGQNSDGKRRVRARIEKTRYFPRPQLFDSLIEATDEPSAPSKPLKTRVKRQRI